MIQPEDHPLVSVCIQTYQHAAYIKDCLDSATSQQTKFPYEIILGEDDSTDGTREICEEYAERYPAIINLFKRCEKDKIYIDGKRTGRFNFIQNLKSASGKYIALLDGDDYWTDNLKLQKQVDFMEKNTDCSISFHKIVWLKKTGHLRRFSYSALYNATTKFTIDDFLNENFIIAVSGMFLRSNIDSIPGWFWDVPVLDYPLYFHCAQKGKIGFLAETMGAYRVHPQGMGSSKKVPERWVTLWRLYYIMAVNIKGEHSAGIISKRHELALELINYYRNHLWKNSEWLLSELQKNQFEDDEELLRLFNYSSAKNNYSRYIFTYCREAARKIIKGY